MMNKEQEIELLKYKIFKLKQELPMLCDSDYYNQCNLIEILEEKLKKLEKELAIG